MSAQFAAHLSFCCREFPRPCPSKMLRTPSLRSTVCFLCTNCMSGSFQSQRSSRACTLWRAGITTSCLLLPQSGRRFTIRESTRAQSNRSTTQGRRPQRTICALHPNRRASSCVRPTRSVTLPKMLAAVSPCHTSFCAVSFLTAHLTTAPPAIDV